jgi:4-amino-4-deoxy-L-arabinose transferase-like glycosyltransferase
VSARLRWHWVVLPAALVAAVASLAVSHLAFPAGSPDHDELAYLSQADALRAGELTLPRTTHDPAFRPFLSGVHGGRIVFKYQPAWPAFLAAVRALTGSARTALALDAAAGVLAVYALAWELGRRRRIAALAAWVLALTPFSVALSGTYLGYHASLTVLLAASALTVRGVRLHSASWLAAGGVLLGLGFFHRSYDAVLWAVPLLVWVGCTTRGRRLRAFSSLGVGVLPFALLYLAYDRAATGHPLEPAFTTSGSLDRFGFGRRASFVAGTTRHALDYQPADAIRTMGRYAAVLPVWTFAGVAGLAFAVLGAAVARRRAGTVMLTATVVIVPLGYALWWGTANSVAFGLHHALGPMYWFPVAGPLAILVAHGLDAVLRRGTLAVAVVAVALVGSGGTSTLVLARDVRAAGAAQRELARQLVAPTGARTLVIADRPYPTAPYVDTTVPADLDGVAHLVALRPRRTGATLALVDRFPDRRSFVSRRLKRSDQPFAPAVLSLARASVRVGDLAVLRLSRPSTHACSYVSIDGETIARAAQHYRLTAGPVARASRRAAVLAPGFHAVSVGITTDRSCDAGAERRELQWEVRAGPGRQLQVLLPARPRHRYVFPGHRPAWVPEQLARRVMGTVEVRDPPG